MTWGWITNGVSGHYKPKSVTIAELALHAPISPWPSSCEEMTTLHDLQCVPWAFRSCLQICHWRWQSAAVKHQSEPVWLILGGHVKAISCWGHTQMWFWEGGWVGQDMGIVLTKLKLSFRICHSWPKSRTLSHRSGQLNGHPLNSLLNSLQSQVLRQGSWRHPRGILKPII